MKTTMLTCDIYNRTKRNIPAMLFTPLLSNIRTRLKDKNILRAEYVYRVELTFVGEALMKTLNREHRGKDLPTDVLSLSYFDKKSADCFAGELFICLSVAEKQARKLKHSLYEEIRFLFVHGILHVFGFDHKKPDDEKRMNRLTDEILTR